MQSLEQTAVRSGIFTGRWEIKLKPHSGPDFSKRCFLFTGQGAATPGMFRPLWDSLETFRARFQEADQIAASERLTKISLYILDPGKIPQSQLSVVRNLALVTAQVALFDHLTGWGIRPHALTGSSIGEFPALACAGVVSFSDMLEIVLARDRSCLQDNHLGYLIAVAEGPRKIRSELKSNYYSISNLNSSSQTVIAVAPEKLQELRAALDAANMRHKLLTTVPQPYHSPLMRESAARFRSWLDSRKLRFLEPSIPLFSSILHDWLSRKNLSSPEMNGVLSRQLVEPVDFIGQIEAVYSRGSYAFLEIGPGSTLSTFARDILTDRDHRIVDLNLFLPAEPAAAHPVRTQEAKSPWFVKLREAIARVTGYEISSISVEDRFQEDLGIDSIKKANILFTVMEADDELKGGYDSAAVRDVGDAIAALSGAAQPADESLPPREPRFSRFARSWRRKDLPPHVVETGGWERVRLSTLRQGGKLPNGGCLVIIGDTTDLDLPSFASVLHRFRSLTAGEVTLVTHSQSGPLAQGCAAFFRALRKERPALFFRHIEFDELPDDTEIARVVGLEAGAPTDTEIRYRAGGRFVSCLESPPAASHTVRLHENAVVVAIGGAKGIGRALLENMDLPGRPVIYIAGRSARDNLSSALDSLSKKFGQVVYEQLDACDVLRVGSFLKAVQQAHGSIDLILNTAGTQNSGLLESRSVGEMQAELASKITPASNIFEACKELRVKRIVHSSSIVAKWGNPGQTVYACANEVLNRMTEQYNREMGRSAAVSVEWPAWNAVGMTAAPGVLNRLRRMGFSLLDPLDAVELLSRDIEDPRQDVVQYADAADFPILRAPLPDHRRMARVIGNPTPDGHFARLLDGRGDLWLNDHAIEGTCYLPAASAMTFSMFLAGLASESEINGMEGFRILRAVEVRDKPVTLRLELFAGEMGPGVRGRTAGLAFQCHTTKSFEARDPRHLPPVAWTPCTAYRKGLLFHGPVFQMLHGIGYTSDGRRAGRIDTSKLAGVYGHPAADRLTLWLDGAFQLLAVEAAERAGIQALPVGVERFALYPHEVPESITLLIDAFEITKGVVRGDVEAWTGNGKAVFRLEGVRMAAIRDTTECFPS
jgi:[acyl-carrier-protein] S-malonyltransferase